MSSSHNLVNSTDILWFASHDGGGVRGGGKQGIPTYTGFEHLSTHVCNENIFLSSRGATSDVSFRYVGTTCSGSQNSCLAISTVHARVGSCVDVLFYRK